MPKTCMQSKMPILLQKGGDVAISRLWRARCGQEALFYQDRIEEMEQTLHSNYTLEEP